MTAVFILAAVAIVIAAPRAALPTIESAKALTLTLISRLVLPPAESALPAAPAAAGPELQPAAPAALPTAVPVRTRWEFGELLPYVVQSGDTLPALAARFNQTTDAILKANPALAVFQSTLPPGRAINIPASYAPLLGSAFHMLPDSAVVYAEDPGNLAEQLQNFDGWVAHRHEPAYSARDGSWDEARPSWDLINEVALQYSVNPRVLLALLEYRSGLLRNADPPASAARNPLRLPPDTRTGMANQLEWAAAQLNDGYYAWRAGTQVELRLLDGSVQRIDPWQNAGTVALLQLFSQLEQPAEFEQSIGPQGFAATYQQLFGDAFAGALLLQPANLRQPAFTLPFKPGVIWSLTGGPHPAWGSSLPWAAMDFAPPALAGTCGQSNEPVTAMAPGVIVRNGYATALLDTDGDNNEHTGWVIFYFHLRSDSIAAVGTRLAAGDALGVASCEGGRSTGTHVHVARKYNGEWLAADSAVAFDLGGWRAVSDGTAYKGRLSFALPAREVRACQCVSDQNRVSW
ncbi:MAG: hypothetical protein RLY92_597 [Chloroflexota bacterium]